MQGFPTSNNLQPEGVRYVKMHDGCEDIAKWLFSALKAWSTKVYE